MLEFDYLLKIFVKSYMLTSQAFNIDFLFFSQINSKNILTQERKYTQIDVVVIVSQLYKSLIIITWKF